MKDVKRRKTDSGSVPTQSARAGYGTTRKIRINVKRRTARKRMLSRRRNARKAIKKVVEKVLTCKDNVGIYTKSYGGDIRTTVPIGKKIVIVHAQRLQGNAGNYTEFGMQFTPYCLKRVLDAASVLYNNKAKSIAGPGILGIVNGNFNPIGLKIDLLYASYKLALTNMTNVQYHVEIIEFTNKFNSNSSVMDNVLELLKGTNWTGGVPGFSNEGNGVWHLEDCLEFGMIKGISSRYAVKSFGRKLVKPGDTINYFTKDKMCIDFQKKLITESEGTDPEIPSFAKGEKQIVIAMTPVVGIVSNGTNYTYAAHTVNSTDTPAHGFVCKIDEVFKLIEPDATLDQYQGDKRTFLCDFTQPTTGVLTRYERDYGPTLTEVQSAV